MDPRPSQSSAPGSGPWGNPGAQSHPFTSSLRDIMNEQTRETKEQDTRDRQRGRNTQWSGKFEAGATGTQTLPTKFTYQGVTPLRRPDTDKQNTTTVVNVRAKHLGQHGYNDLVEWTKNPNNVYIGRNMTHYVPGAVGSMWQNPFKDKKFGREECVRRYKEYIKTNKQIQSNGRTLLDSLHELKGKTLGCWCHPERCHGHALVELIDEYVPD